jgi:alkylation response protein AidB-like acyl-CoA dehydrogenase
VTTAADPATTNTIGTAPDPGVAGLGTMVDAWLANNGAELGRRWDAARTLDEQMTYLRGLFGMLWESGLSRWGWPETAGGRGGSPLLRAVVAERLALAGLAPTFSTMPEVLAAPFAAAARAELVRSHLSRYLSGEDWWCQGFSEPGAGSDLAALSTTAVRDGEDFVVNGQKIWTTLAQHAQRGLFLVRTGPREQAHRTLSLLFLDMDSPGVLVRPITASTQEPEFCEVFLCDVRVPTSRLVGPENGAWPIVMNVLACERATVFWGRVAWMHRWLERVIKRAPHGETTAKAVGEAFALIAALRARSLATQHAVAEGRFNAIESSIDKVLMATAEQTLFDVAAAMDGPAIALGDSDDDLALRKEYVMSRVASVYGGTAEIQRNIIAERLLGMPRPR